MNTIWLAQIGVHLWKEGVNPESQDPLHWAWVLAVVLVGAFFVFFLMAEAIRNGRASQEESFQRPFPKYRRLPHRRHHRHHRHKGEARPPSNQATCAHGSDSARGIEE